MIAPPPAPAAQVAAAPTAPAIDYLAITRSVEVARPAADAWRRVGAFCAIGEWMKTTCRYLSGSGEAGSVRVILNGATTEVMVGRTPLSYTYWQTRGNLAAEGYHGTLAAEPMDGARSRLVYTLVYDQAAFASDALRASEHARLEARFQALLETMKSLVEAP